MRLSFLTTVLVAGVLLLAGCADTAGEEGDAYADAMAEQHRDDTTQPSEVLAAPAVPVTADTVTYGAGVTGYLAVPEQPDSLLAARGGAGESVPGLIVIHEWWGLNDNIRAMTRQLAGAGYQALAVDLYEGEVAQTPEEARALIGRAIDRQEQVVQNMEAAYRYLTEERGAPEVGVIGWCFGGSMAIEAALALPSALDATVIYYGHVQSYDRAQLQALQMPILAFFGAKDSSIPVEAVRTFEQTLNELGKNVEVHVYENAGHAFANPTGENYVAEAAEDAWEETTAFLKEYLWDAE